ncbi:MAG: GNAT family N-acetyltransferase [Flavobacterium sp.]|nr:MAG: GNAT family N-acetyltransferase [Flavobacterium sp.]
MDKLKIIDFKESDRDALRELFLKVRQSTFVWKDPEDFDLFDFDKQTLGEYIMTAFYEEKIVGFISIWLPDNFIHHLFIDEEFQKMGIGKELLKAAINKTGFPIKLKCLEKNIQAVQFYKKTGFIEKGKGGVGENSFIAFELNQEIE